MPTSSLRFRIEGENSSALRAISEVKREAQGLGNDLQRHIGEKLKTAFSVAVVEEVVRRTGEWASELAKSAKALNITREQLQTIRVAAERAGVAQEKIFSFYDKIEARAQKAASGNKTLMQSFASLGVSMADIKGPNRLGTVELGQKVLAGASHPGGEAALVNLGFGKSITETMALANQFKGKSLSEYQKEHQFQIVSEGTTGNIATAWTNIVEDIRSIGNKLAPIASLLLTLVDGILKMVNGVVGEASHILKGGWLALKTGGGLWGSKEDNNAFVQWGREREERNKAGLRDLGNTIPQAISLGHWKPFGEQALGPNLTEEARREAEGGMQGLITAATFGVPVGKLGSMRVGGLKGVQSSMPGMVSSAIERLAFKGKPFLQEVKNMAPEEVAEHIVELNRTYPGLYSPEDMFATAKMVGERMGSANRIKMFSKLSGYAGMGGLTSLIGAEDIKSNPMYSGGGSAPPPNRGGFLDKLGQGYGAGGGSANLAIGGVFGSDIQGKIVSLNSKMVDLLQQIVVNTTPFSQDNGNDEEGGSGLAD